MCRILKTREEKRLLTQVFDRAIRKRFDGDSRAIRIILKRFGFLPHVIVPVFATLMAIQTRPLTPLIMLRGGKSVSSGSESLGSRGWGSGDTRF